MVLIVTEVRFPGKQSEVEIGFQRLSWESRGVEDTVLGRGKW